LLLKESWENMWQQKYCHCAVTCCRHTTTHSLSEV